MDKNQETSNLRKYQSFNPLKRFFLNNFQKELISLIAPLNPKKILDAGCGEGFILKKLYELKLGKHLEGIDASKKAIEIGKKLHPFLDLKLGDIYKFSYKNDSFDLVICTEVLEHLDDPQKALSDILRVSLRYVVLTVPNEPWWTLFNYTKWRKDTGHINHWTSKNFEKFVEENSKLKILDIKHPFPWTMILVHKLSL